LHLTKKDDLIIITLCKAQRFILQNEEWKSDGNFRLASHWCLFFIFIAFILDYYVYRDRRGRDRMIIGFITRSIVEINKVCIS